MVQKIIDSGVIKRAATKAELLQRKEARGTAEIRRAVAAMQSASWLARSLQVRPARGSRPPRQYRPRGPQQRIHLAIGPDRDAQRIPRLRIIKPTHQDFAFAKFVLPLLR